MSTRAKNIISAAVQGNCAGMPVVLYLRKSNKTKSKSRDETVSIQQQRADLRAWCESKGWIIIREYIDDGKSASKNDRKRIEFAKLMDDCTHADFRAVVVWDLSRLTRKDSVDAATAAAVLKDNALLVESFRDGEIDLTISMGRHMWNLHCEGNSEFALKVSAGTRRGRDDSLSRGNWPHGKVPYGYRRQYWDGDTLIQDMHRNDKAGKARHWATRIVPDPNESKYAAQIIRDFASRDISIRGLAIEMTKAGAPTMHGSPWNAEHIKDIIRCPVYIGTLAIGYSHGWKKSVEGHGYEAHGHSDHQEKDDACPSIVDREIWERANAKLDKTQNGRRVHAGKSSPLSGIVYCGHCGRAMAKNTKKGVTRFVCSTAAKNSENPTCKQWTVQEADLLPIFTSRLVEAVDFKILNELAAKPSEGNGKQLANLEKQEAELAQKVSRAARNLALCDSAIYDDVQAVLTELKAELDKVKNTAHLLRTAGDKTQLEHIANWWKNHWPTLVEVREPQEVVSTPRTLPNGKTVQTLPVDMFDRVIGIKAEPDVFRDLLKRLDAKISLHFTPKAQGPNAKKQYYALEWGRIEATLSGHSFEPSGRGKRAGRIARRCGHRWRGRGKFRRSGLERGR